MKPAAWRLLLAACLFLVWISWLAYLAFTAGTRPEMPVPKRPIVLSRPQFLISNFDVIAQVEEVEGEPGSTLVTILEVLWPPAEESRKNTIIAVQDLSSCPGWAGPDLYILPLVTKDYKTCTVARLPRSPGIEFHGPRIYRANDQTREQLKQIQKADGTRLGE
jgi:hypothetical protein